MGLFEFIAALVKELAWPVSLGLVVVVFRKPILELIDRISKISHGDTAVEFDRIGLGVKANLAVSKPVTKVGQAPALAMNEKVDANTNIGRIVTAWSELEDIVRQRLIDARVDKASTISGKGLLTAAAVHKLITAEQLNSLLGLSTMRNLAVHGRASEIDERRTLEFLVLAEAMTTVLGMIKPKDE